MNMFIAAGTSARPPIKKIAATSPTESAKALNQKDDAQTVNANHSVVTALTVISRSRCEGSAWRSRGRSISGARTRASAAGASAAGDSDFEERGAELDIPSFYRCQPRAQTPKSGEE